MHITGRYKTKLICTSLVDTGLLDGLIKCEESLKKNLPKNYDSTFCDIT